MNQINIIGPYKYLDMWVFDDPQKNLLHEPFVGGADTILDRLTSTIPNPEAGFILIFSSSRFPGSQHTLTWRRVELSGNIYYSPDLALEGWLCPALLRYFDAPPSELFFQIKPKPSTGK
jgi:hypothetical protein